MADIEDGLDSPMNIHTEHKTAAEVQQWLTEAARNVPPGAMIKKTLTASLDYSNPTPYPTGDDALIEITGCQIAAGVIDGHCVIDLNIYVSNDEFFKYWSAPSSPDEIKRGDENDTWQVVTRINGVNEVKVKRDGHELIFKEPEAGANYVDIATPAYPAIIALNPDDLGIYYVYCKGFWQKIGLPYPDDEQQAELTVQIYDRNTQHEAAMKGAANYISLRPWEENGGAGPGGNIGQSDPQQKLFELEETPADIKRDRTNRTRNIADDLPEFLLLPAGTITQGISSGLSTIRYWSPDPAPRIAQGMLKQFTHGGLKVTIGIDQTDSKAGLFEYLKTRGPLAIKAFIVLISRYLDAPPDVGHFFHISIEQTVDDFAYERRPDGCYRDDAKKAVREILNTMLKIQCRISYVDGKGEPVSKYGPLFVEGVQEERGKPGEKKTAPRIFSFGVGEWLAHDQALHPGNGGAKCASSLLKLDHKYKPLALSIGLYLTLQGRVNQYKPYVLRIRTILSAVKFAQTKDQARRAAYNEKMFFDALQDLKDVGFFKDYMLIDADAAHDFDMDDPTEIEESAFENPEPANQWRHKRLRIIPLFEADGERLEERQAQRIREAQLKAAAPRKRGRPRKHSLKII